MTPQQKDVLAEMREAIRSEHADDEPLADLACRILAFHAEHPTETLQAPEFLAEEYGNSKAERRGLFRAAYDLLEKDGWLDCRTVEVGIKGEVRINYRLARQAAAPLGYPAAG